MVITDDGFDWTDVSASSTIEASVLRNRLAKVQKYINYDVDHAFDFNFEDGNLLETKNIFKPDLYGSPSPRMEGVSSQVHFRRVENDYTKGAYFSSATVGDRYVAVPGLCTRIKMSEPGMVHYRSSFYGFEIGGAARAKAEWSLKPTSGTLMGFPLGLDDIHTQVEFGLEYTNAAKLKLFVNGRGQDSTEKRIKTSAVKALDQKARNCHGGHIFQCMISRHQHSVVWAGYLPAGIHDIGICIRPSAHRVLPMMGLAHSEASSSKTPEFYQHKHIYTLARTMVCDVVYEDGDYQVTYEPDEVDLPDVVRSEDIEPPDSTTNTTATTTSAGY